MDAREVDIVATSDTLLTAHGPGVDLHALPQLRAGAGGHLARGIDYLMYAIADGIVDGYFPVLDRLADDIDALEDDVVEHASTWSLQRLFTLKRELITLGLIESFLNGVLVYFPALGQRYTDIFAFAVLIGILIFRPSGLLGERVDEKV